MAKYKLSSRNKARRRAIDTIFEADLRGLDREPDKIRQLVQQRCQLTTRQTTLPPYAQEIALGVADHIFEIDDLIDDYSEDWSLDRLAATDLAIMRCALWEIKYNDEVPWKTAVDEAVSISRDISTPQSPVFLNGVLDAIAKGLEEGEREGTLLAQAVDLVPEDNLAELPVGPEIAADWETSSLFEAVAEDESTAESDPDSEDPLVET